MATDQDRVIHFHDGISWQPTTVRLAAELATEAVESERGPAQEALHELRGYMESLTDPATFRKRVEAFYANWRKARNSR